MSKEKYSAFPFEPRSEIAGMTLRDYFAARAMQTLLASTYFRANNFECATTAYAVADAMLKARET